MALIEKLKAAEGFTSTEKTLADCILANRDTALRMTLQKLADIAFVSKPTVIRLYRKLGYESYTDFQLAFYSELARHGGDVKTVDPNWPFKGRESYLTIAESICSLTKQTVDACFAQIDQAELTYAATIICAAKRVFIFAIGDNYIQALAFRNKLVKLNRYVILVNEMGEENIHPYNATADDCAIFITFGGRTLQNRMKIAEYMHKQGTKLVLMTGLHDTSLLKTFDCVLRLAKGEDNNLKIGTISSQIATHYMLDVLYSCIFEQEYEQNIKKNRGYYEFQLENGLT